MKMCKFASFICTINSKVYFLSTQKNSRLPMEAETEEDSSKEILAGLEDTEVPEALEDIEVLVDVGEADMENSRDIEETSVVEEKKAVDGETSAAGEEEADFGEGKEALLEEVATVGDKETALGGEKVYIAKEKTVSAIEMDDAFVEELKAVQEEIRVGDEQVEMKETEAEKEVEPERKETEEDGGEGKEAVMEAVRGQEESPALKQLDPNTLGKYETCVVFMYLSVPSCTLQFAVDF
jgi:hypothetical protein